MTKIVAKDFVPRGQFQDDGTEFLIDNDRAQFSVAMGLGKTIMTLNAINKLFLCGYMSEPVLVIGPKKVARNTWSDEVKKWTHLTHLKVSPILGTPNQRLAALNAEADIYTISYDNLVWLVQHYKGDWPFRTVVADESTKLKANRAYFQTSSKGKKFLVRVGGARTKALAAVAFSRVKRFWNLTGTLCPNGMHQLWGPYWYLDGGKRLSRVYSDFQDRWFRVGYNGFGLEAFDHTEAQIMAAISDITFTLRAEDYLALEPEIINTIYVDLPTCQMIQYRQMEKDLFVQIKNGDVEVFSQAAKSMKLHQMANGTIYYDDKGNYEDIHDEKIEALKSVIEEANGMPVLVVYTFKSDLKRLMAAFPSGRKFDNNPQTEKDFKAGKIPILFLHPKSAGHGVDGFQYVTNIIVFFSVDWDGEDRLQTIARIGAVRQLQAGFKRPVYIHQILARDTVDEDIVSRIDGKLTVEESLKAGLARRNSRI
jgi:SNF2 family DNA or RNA helicase